MKLRSLFLSLILLSFFLGAQEAKAFFEQIFNLANWKSPYQSADYNQAKSKAKIEFIFVSDINLYPVPLASETPAKIDFKDGIAYRESQVLLQELIKDILDASKKQVIDFVLFGGNQVSDPAYQDLFIDIVHELKKHSLDYHSVLGPNDSPKDSYYKFRVKDLNILVLNNVTERPVPLYVPEEANEQYIWLRKTLKSIENLQEDLCIFAYKELDTQTINLINEFPRLNLKLIGYSGEYQFSSKSVSELRTESKAIRWTQLKLNSNPLILSNSALSAYPCSYTLISRQEDGRISVKNISSSLRGVVEKSKTLRSGE
jgi:hypothetical protein